MNSIIHIPILVSKMESFGNIVEHVTKMSSLVLLKKKSGNKLNLSLVGNHHLPFKCLLFLDSSSSP